LKWGGAGVQTSGSPPKFWLGTANSKLHPLREQSSQRTVNNGRKDILNVLSLAQEIRVVKAQLFLCVTIKKYESGPLLTSTLMESSSQNFTYRGRSAVPIG
jgi:hypothetical protein